MNTAEIVSDRCSKAENPRLLADAETRTSVVVPLFTSTLFVSAFLLFLVQPMVAKMVLPLLGGSPMVWNTCMVFFQIALLVGYAYAHGATRSLDRRVQVALHVALLILPFSVLPFLIGPRHHASDGRHADRVAAAAAGGAIGLPFFTLATSASVLQHWFSRTNHPSARDPYFLYVASNIGSFVALMAYPSVVEPSLSLHDQSRLWTAGYGVFAVLVIGCALFAWRAGMKTSQLPGQAADIAPADAPAADRAAPGMVGGARVHSVQPDARGDDVSVDRRRRGAASVDRAAGALSASPSSQRSARRRARCKPSRGGCFRCCSFPSRCC